MRTNALVQLALALALAGCSSGAHRANDSATAAPSPLHACETRELTVDDADVILVANADARVGSVAIVSAPSDDAREKALDDVTHTFGTPHPDTAVIAHPSKWGLTTYSDRCGHPVSPAGAPPASNGPVAPP